MKRLLPSLLALAALLALGGCLTSPVARSGGPGSITVPNTNAEAIRRAAQEIFPRYGYTSSRGGAFPRTLAFERPAGRTGELMFGSFNQNTTFRVRIHLNPIAGTNDIRLTSQVYRVNSADRPGFERETRMLRSWSAQFQSILREIQATAGNAGPGR